MHSQFQKQYIWGKLRQAAQNLLGIAGLGNHLYIALRAEERAQPETSDRVVIGDEDSYQFVWLFR